MLPVHAGTNMNPDNCVQHKEDCVEKLCSCTGSNKFYCFTQNITDIFYSTHNIHNKIVPGYRIESTIPTVLHDLWMKFLLMCRPATFTGLSLTVSLIHKRMTIAARVHCIVVTLIIHSCVCTAIHKRYLSTSQ